MAQPIITVQTNSSIDVSIISSPVVNPQDLTYTKGGGNLFPNLVEDIVQGGKWYFGGNPLIDIDYKVKSCENLTIVNKPVETVSNIVDKGIYYYNPSDSKYYWDEVYTTPLGIYNCVTTPNAANYEFGLDSGTNSNIFNVVVKDVNINPKVNDYIIVQKLPSDFVFSNTSYTDDLFNLPVVMNTELYQFKIKTVALVSGSGTSVIYKLTLDKSISLQLNQQYCLVLLNRENTGIQKELFYDTFEQVEIHRQQLIGDPYNNTSNLALPAGRKNYLNYTGSSYLGLSTLLSKLIVNDPTPFIVYDLNNELKDRFNPANNTVEILLPSVMFQNDTRTGALLNTPSKLKNLSGISNELTGVGKYSGLYFDWDTQLNNRVGWIFYELRILVIDDPELATALGYNSNRNYTTPKPQMTINFGNDLANPGGGVDLIIDDISNGNEVIVTTSTPHSLLEGTAVFISDAYVQDAVGNIIPASANGNHFVKLLVPNDPFKFKLYDATLTVPVQGNGIFYKNSASDPAKVKGTLPRYSYFYTYRLVGKHYESILPYARLTDFNFAIDGKVSNTASGILSINFDKFKWLIDNSNSKGFEAVDMEIIIGQYKNDDLTNPQLVTGIANVVSIPITELFNARSLFDGSGNQTDFSTNVGALKVTKQDYDTFVSKIANGGVYNKVTNPNGNPTYDVINIYPLYTYSDASPVPSDLVVGKGKWTLGNVKFQTQSQKYRSVMRLVIPADKWNDTTNPTYDPNNPFIKNRFISEVAVVLTDPETNIDQPMIYTKIAPAIKKSNDLDLVISMNIDW